MSMQENRKPCRCLLEEAQPDLARVVSDVIAALPEDDLADAGTRDFRLARCLQCDDLLDGTCRLCGCYVEVRAAKKTMHCPAVPDRWQRLSP